jgi:hypothetical protein
MRRSAWLLIPIGFAALRRFVFTDVTTLPQIVLFDAWIGLTLGLTSLFSAATLLVASATSPTRSPPLVLSCIVAVGCSFVVVVALFSPLFDRWSASAPRTGPDGREYVALAGFWTTGIGRVADRTLGRTTIDVLVTAGTDSPRACAALVRPATAPDSTLYFSPDGLVVEDHGAHTYAAVALDGSRTFGRRNIQDLSPFVLLDATTNGLDTDVESIAAYVKQHASKVTRPDAPADAQSEIPSEASLLAALDSANPWVRAAARRIVEAGGAAMYPEATRRLASAPK